MIKFKQSWTGVIFAFTLFYIHQAHGQDMDWENLVGKSHAERTVLLTNYYKGGMLNYDSTTIFGHADLLKKLAREHDDPDLAYEADCLQAHYFYFSNHLSDRMVLDSLYDILAIAKREEVLWLRVRTESLIGHFNFNRLREYEQATIHLAKAAELLDGKSGEEYPLKQVCNYHIGLALYILNDFENSLKYLRVSAKSSFVNGMNDFRINVVNTMGVIHRKQNKLDSSDHYFKKTMALSREREHETWIAIAGGNLGENHYLRDEFDEAIPLLQHDARVSALSGDWGVASNALTLLGDIALQKGNIERADSLLQQALHYAYKVDNAFERLEVVLPRMAKLKASQSEAHLSSLYIDSALLVSDSLERKSRKMLSARSQQKLERERYLDKLTRLELEKEKRVLERNMMLTSGIAILLLAILLYNALWSKYVLKNKQLALSEEELKKSKKRLIEITDSLAERNKRIEELNTKSSSSSSNGVLELQQKTILTEDDWDEFRTLFESTFPGFFENLNKKQAGLTQAEIRFIALRKLDITPKKIAGILGVGDGAIRQYRYRIRKKIGVEDLQGFINSI